MKLTCLKAFTPFSHAARSQNRLVWLAVLAGLLLFPVTVLAPVHVRAQSTTSSCPVRVPFPPPGTTPTVYNAGTLCLENTEFGADVFLRFLNSSGNPPNGLALFNQGGPVEVWCAHASNGSCAQGTQLVFRPDGNLELNDGNIQTWDTDTPNTNNGHEFLKVTGDGHACIVVVDPSTNTETRIWCTNNA